MPGPYDLQGKFIADTYTHLMQKPDINKEEYYNGNGDQIIVINRDAIGTIKMFYPANGVLDNYFDKDSGLPRNPSIYPEAAVWQGWALCDGQGGRPDLRGRFIVGHTYTIPGDTSTNSQRNNTAFQQIGTAGAGNFTGDDTAEPKIDINNLPPHRHKYFDGFINVQEGVGGGSFFSELLETHANSQGVNWNLPVQGANFINEGGGPNEDRYGAYHDRNTGDGSDNINNQGELKSTPDNFYPAYVALVYVMRVS